MMKNLISTFTSLALSFCIVGCASTGNQLGVPDNTTLSNITIHSSDYIKIKDLTVNVKVYKPNAQATAKPAVILLSGCDGKLSEGGETLRANLLRKGVVVAELQSIQAHGNACNARTITGRQRATETFKARDALVASGLANEDNVGLLGFSHGGWAISVAIFNEGDGTYNPKVTKPFKTAVALYPFCQMGESSNYVNKTDTLMLVSRSDKWTPADYCRSLKEYIDDNKASKKFHVVDFVNATHAWDVNYSARYIQTNQGLQFMQYNAEVTKASIKMANEWFEAHLSF